MDTDDRSLPAHVYPPRLWHHITSVLVVSAIGAWLSVIPFITQTLRLQIIGSGWWQDGGMGMGGLLLALAGFSSKVSTLATRREPGRKWPRRLRFRDMFTEALGLAIFVAFGVLPLSIHSFNPLWSVLVLSPVIAIWLFIKSRSLLHNDKATKGTDRNDAESFVADSSLLSRRALVSGGLILGVAASGIAALWRTFSLLIPDYTFFGHSDTVSALSWFPNGRRIASMSRNGQFFIWNAADGSNLRTLAPIAYGLPNMQVSPNGRLIAASEYGAVYIVDATTGALLWKYFPGEYYFRFSWSPDSTRVVVLAYYLDIARASSGNEEVDYGGQVFIRDALTGAEKTPTIVLSNEFAPQAIAWSPDGRSIAAADAAQIVIWDAASGELREQFTLPVATHKIVYDLSWSPDGRSLAVALKPVIYVLSVYNAAPLIAYRGFASAEWHEAASWSPDSRYIASCSTEERAVRVWEAATGKTLFVYNGHFSLVKTVAWSPDGRRIASGGWDNLVHVWRPILPA